MKRYLCYSNNDLTTSKKLKPDFLFNSYIIPHNIYSNTYSSAHNKYSYKRKHETDIINPYKKLPKIFHQTTLCCEHSEKYICDIYECDGKPSNNFDKGMSYIN